MAALLPCESRFRVTGSKPVMPYQAARASERREECQARNAIAQSLRMRWAYFGRAAAPATGSHPRPVKSPDRQCKHHQRNQDNRGECREEAGSHTPVSTRISEPRASESGMRDAKLDILWNAASSAIRSPSFRREFSIAVLAGTRIFSIRLPSGGKNYRAGSPLDRIVTMLLNAVQARKSFTSTSR